MRQLKLTICALVAASALIGSVASHADQLIKRDLPSNDAKVTNLLFDGNDLSLRVKLIAEELSVEFTLTQGSRTATLAPPAQFLDDFRQVIHYKNSLIVVAGIAPYQNFSNFTVIDLATLSVKTSFNAYYASLSPDSSKVAFVRFYPLHFTVNPEDQYYVVSFDDAGAAPVNRTGSATDPLEPAGIRILTVTGEQRDRANVNVPPDDAHQVLGNFTWSADGRVLGFVDGVGKHPPRLVTASFGGTKPEVKRYMVQSGIRPDGKLEIDLATPTSPALVRIQRQQGGVVSRALVNLGAPEVIPQ